MFWSILARHYNNSGVNVYDYCQITDDKRSKLRLKNKSKPPYEHFFIQDIAVVFKMWWRRVLSLDCQQGFGKQNKRIGEKRKNTDNSGC